MKKLIGIFLLCCMVFSLLPVVALAETDDVLVKVYVSPTKFDQIDIYAKKGTVTYAKNTADGYTEIVKAGVSDGTKYDYNLKLDFTGDKPVLYLNGLNMGRYNAQTQEYSIPLQGLEFPTGYAVPDIVVESDSSITCWSECLGFRNGGSLTSVGDAKLTLLGGNGGIWIQGDTAVTINANLDITVPDETYSTSAVCIGAEQEASIVIEGGTINLSGFYNAIRVNDGNLTINGGTINAASRGDEEQPAIKVNGNLTINGGTVNATSSEEDGGSGIFVNNGDMVINGGSVNAEGRNYAIENKGGGNLIVNGGTLEAKSLNDGTRYNVFNEIPNLSNYGTYDAYIGADADTATFYVDAEQSTKAKYFKITAGTGSATAPTVIPTTAPATTPTTAQTQATKPATKPTAPTKAPTQPVTPTEGDGDMTMALIAAAVVVAVIAAAAVAVIVIKKKKK